MAIAYGSYSSKASSARGQRIDSPSSYFDKGQIAESLTGLLQPIADQPDTGYCPKCRLQLPGLKVHRSVSFHAATTG